ncbi:ATP-binding cassette domain-containing protein [Fulvivirga sp. M361]|uniref:ATP-binding cassette domain-containing protein n=1 Tax=Fulvivirga sp. M361 TaxID=2594266 RepID=UPI00117B0B2D|nr:ATP-binding cassette domain-containing protein [Fulvivirga sp. M361]TRX51755.1 ATP-binding cassette domain-containing protein [Fulvivirga sp. M361]
MSEELLKAVIQMFAIVAKERVTEDERANIKDFLLVHLNQEAIGYYLKLFDDYCCEYEVEAAKDLENLDSETLAFVDDWAKIMAIAKQVNEALTMQQKVVMIVKIVELLYADGDISERQENLIFYISEALKIGRRDIMTIKSFIIGQDPDELSSRNILIIDEGSGDLEIEGPSMVAKNLTGLIAILRLPDIETYFIKYLGISTLYLNSIQLKSRKIDIFPTGSTIRGSKINTIYYSDIVSRFLIGQVETNLTLSAEHIFYHFKSGRAGLQNVGLTVEGGKLIGIMGSSGSGKSTFLNVLNGSERPSSGRVLINGVNIHEYPEKVEGVIGYIPQDDLLIEELTVFENLYYAARLCFEQYSAKTTERLVEKVLLNLGLSEIRNLKVGSPLEKTISGGQRKRVNIGLELLREPSVLFVDEPTSGLSSQDSENIMDLLKELSLRGKMVFVVIHQPSSDIFKMFDNLLILDIGGLQIYYGNPIEAVTYFKEIVNAANKNQSACPECGNVNAEQIFSIIETRVVNEFGRLTNVRKISPGQWYQFFRDSIKIPKVRHSEEKIKTRQHIPGWFSQLKVFITRDILAKMSNRQYLAINLLEAPLLAMFMSFLVRYYSTIGDSERTYSFYQNENIPIYFFMSIIVALFMGLTVSAEEIFRDRRILKRERFLNLSKSGYLVSKILVLFMISAVQTISFVMIGDMILQIEGMGLRYWMILFSCSACANLLGLNISATFNSAVTIYILIPLLLIPQLLLSGVVINFDKFNPSVTTLDGVPLVGEFMASRWAFEAAMVTQFKDNAFESQFYHLDRQAALAEYKKLYHIPTVQSKLVYAFNNLKERLTPKRERISKSLSIVRNEIEDELEIVGADKFTQMDRLYIDKFDSLGYMEANRFLTTMERFYSQRYANTVRQKDHIIDSLTATPQTKKSFDSMRFVYQNEAIYTTLTNRTSVHRVIEVEDRLIQKIYPIYFEDHDPGHLLDVRSKFFVPEKHLAGKYFDTLAFNITVIWCMTLLLYVSLYYDGLKRIMRIFDSDKRRRRAKN